MVDTKLYSNETEVEILGIMLVDSSKIPSIKSLISRDDLFPEAHKIIYDAIIEMNDKGKTVDIVTVSELLDFNNTLDKVGGRMYINDLATNYTSSGAVKNYCNIVVNYSKKRKLISLCEQSISALTEGADVADVGITLKATTEDVLINKSSDKLNHIASGTLEVVDQLEATLSSEDKLLGLTTPYVTLNRALSGLVGGRFYILGARPSMGKTSLAMNLASHIAEKKNVVVASLEMGLAEYTQRELFARSNTNQDMISNGMVNEDIYKKIFASACELEKLGLYIIDDAKCSLNTIENGIINCIAKNGSCDLVLIDYLQLMSGDDKRVRDDYDIVTKNSKGLKQLARKYKIPIVALCQLSRALESRPDKRPILSDLRDSGAIEQDADVVMFLYRDEVYHQDPNNRGKAELIIRKNRQGKLAQIPMLFEASKTKFTEERRW